MPSFIALLEQCAFPSIGHFTLDYKTTSSRGSVVAEFSESSLPLSLPGVYLQCSKLRTSQYPQLYRRNVWHIEPAFLDATIMGAFFGGNIQHYKEFVDYQARILENFRTYFFYCIHDENGHRIPRKTIREIREFQPLFQLFLGGFLECLQSFQSGSTIMRRTVSVNNLKIMKTLGDDHIPLVGTLDVMIFSHSDERIVDVCMSDSHIELKSPFGALYHSQSAKEIDQLIAETDCVSAMKADSSVSPSSGPTIGALTDLFSLNLIYHDESSSNSRAFYLTSPVVEPRSYIQQLLVLCMQSADVAKLTVSSMVSSIPFLEEERVEDEVEQGGGGGGKDGFDDADKIEEGTHQQHHQQQQQQQQQQQGGKEREAIKCWYSEDDENTDSTRSSTHVHPTIIYIKSDKEEELEEDFEFLRQFEMRRTGVTLTRSNLEALGALR